MNTALTAARRERWATVSLAPLIDGTDAPWRVIDHDPRADPEQRALRTEVMAAIRDGIEQHLTPRQQQVLRAVIFEDVPLDEVVRHLSSNRNAVYKLLHDARRKLKAYLVARGFDIDEILGIFASGG